MSTTHSTLAEILDLYRKERNFKVDDYIKRKIEALNDFFTSEKLDSAIIGISGGVDSAVTFYLLDLAAKKENSPIKKILPLSLPIYNAPGVSEQEEAAKNAAIVIEQVGYPYQEINLENAYFSLLDSGGFMTESFSEFDLLWAEGQMASVLRTPVFYYYAALLQAAGFKSIVVGTTNRDEGSYIGFFGKASDGMVDLQPIADLHKSEVLQVAQRLNVPQQIINLTPKGDVWNQQTDEDMIGAPYWFLELFLSFKSINPGKEFQNIIRAMMLSNLSAEETKLFDHYAYAIEALHEKNLHKYKVGSPAQFIDVMDRKIYAGWM